MRVFFEGWYYKQQAADGLIALIPAVHGDQNGITASLQIVIPGQAYCIGFPKEALRVISRKEPRVALGNSLFSSEGITLDISTDDLKAYGKLSYGPLKRPSRDIMGPFRFMPLMECRHSVFSMAHEVYGELTLNGSKMSFESGMGYIEGDRGYSFPKRYLWTHCSADEASLMLSVADIPFLGGTFTGVISLIMFRGQEYRLATYLGAKTVSVKDGHAEIRQGDLTLTVHLMEEKSQLLAAPVQGSMTRHIRESLACRVNYRFCRGEEVLFDFISNCASFENEYH